MTAVHRPMDAREVAVQERIAALEHALGDIDDPGNPLGAQQFLAADARRRMLPAAERLLDDACVNAEFVPVALGGRYDRLDALARVLRAVFRRDAALGLGYGLASHLAAVVVWADGSSAQRRATADLLLGGGRLACAYPEPVQANAFLANRLTARPDGDGYLLSGVKPGLNNAARAEGLLLFARTGGGEDVDEHSAFLLRGPARAGAGVTLLPRVKTLGVRGCAVQGLRFERHRLRAEWLVGRPGEGGGMAENAFPLTRGVGLSSALGCVDTALRTTVGFALSHRSRGSASLSTHRTRTALVGTFLDLLWCDCLALVATRSAHLLPRECATLGAVAKYLLPAILTESLYDLAAVLGSESYSGDGHYGTFHKIVRDLPMLGLGNGGSAASRRLLAGHLLRLPELCDPSVPPAARPDAPAGLFRPFDAALPPCSPEAFARPAEADTLLSSLEHSARVAATAPGPEGARLAEGASALVTALHGLLEECGERAWPAGRRPGPGLYGAADRYALLVAGAACLGVWRQQAAAGTGFLADPAWAAGALGRLVCRLGAAARPAPADSGLVDHLVWRFDDARSFDLYSTAVGA